MITRLLRKVKQRYDENEHLYEERMLALVSDAFDGQDETLVAVLRQLIDFFIDRLYHDYIRMKILCEKTVTFENAVTRSFNEQNIRKRFQVRSGREFTTRTQHDH